MQSHLDTATSIATWFDAFLKHGSIVSVLLSLAFGWGLSIFLSFPIHRAVNDDELATFYARCACVVGSFAVTAATWPNEWRWSWAGTMGVLSPLAGLIAIHFISKWWPDFATNVLSMKKVTPKDPGDEAGA